MLIPLTEVNSVHVLVHVQKNQFPSTMEIRGTIILQA
jgi:hypothetical protein